jgi:hypothetical protein
MDSPQPQKPKARRKKPEAVAEIAPTFRCEFCKTEFKRENSLIAHSCEQKRRHLDQGEKSSKLGFWVYQRFYTANYRMKAARTFEQFRTSSVYTAFIKFARYLLDINAVNPHGFVDFVIKSGVKLDDWRSPLVYETYIRELNKKETADAALERNLLLMQQWSDDTGEAWTDFFRKIAAPLATAWIRSGRISPWVLYTAPSAETLITRLSDEQMGIIEAVIEPKFWMPKLESEGDVVDAIRAELEAAGL